MFWMKKDDGKPAEVSGAMSRSIGNEWGKIPRSEEHWAEYLAVMRPQGNGGDLFDVRIFDKWMVGERKVAVTDYSTLDDHPDLVLLAGWWNKKTKKGEIKAMVK